MEPYGIVFYVYKLNVLLSCIEPSRASYGIVQKKLVCVILLTLRFVGRIVIELYRIVFCMLNYALLELYVTVHRIMLELYELFSGPKKNPTSQWAQ